MLYSPQRFALCTLALPHVSLPHHFILRVALQLLCFAKHSSHRLLMKCPGGTGYREPPHSRTFHSRTFHSPQRFALCTLTLLLHTISFCVHIAHYFISETAGRLDSQGALRTQTFRSQRLDSLFHSLRGVSPHTLALHVVHIAHYFISERCALGMSEV